MISREVEVLPIVSHPIDLEADVTSQFDEGGDASEEGGGPARFQYNHVGVYEERAFAEDVGVEVPIGNAGEDGATGTSADAIKGGTGEGA